jgi:hypothetical protein
MPLLRRYTPTQHNINLKSVRKLLRDHCPGDINSHRIAVPMEFQTAIRVAHLPAKSSLQGSTTS